MVTLAQLLQLGEFGTSVRRHHNDGTSTTGAQSASQTMVSLPPQPPQSASQSTQYGNPPGDYVDDIAMESQPPSGTSSDSSTISVDTVNGIQQLIWRTQPSPHPLPLVRTILQSA
eukprot:6490758-Amphidinium_carterae.1